ncbi:MAG: Nucleic acid dioxygenase alkbh1 [Sclerophora amabilis]|nr:MAG: Nucleic acid dioxygenase alkbh1 [Sclerophora amabilis]
MTSPKPLTAHALPPDELRQLYKRYQKSSIPVHDDAGIVDFDDETPNFPAKHHLVQVGSITAGNIRNVCNEFNGSDEVNECGLSLGDFGIDRPIYECRGLPGLQIVPKLLPPETQLCLLTRLLHRDLSNSHHKTNVHTHHHMLYPKGASRAEAKPSEPYEEHITINQEQVSFFDAQSRSVCFLPKDPVVHKPLTISQFLDKKLRWMTLGGQYDWTKKTYPDETPPAFPGDIARLLRGILPNMKPQAAIVNLYSPGDTLSLHRDVSEQCDRPLVSISLGCDALFVIGAEFEEGNPGSGSTDSSESGPGRREHLVIRVHSGDAVYMSGKARFAWHGVPKIVKGTCPDFMENWPARPNSSTSSQLPGNDQFEEWSGWMATKRINLNVRQICE